MCVCVYIYIYENISPMNNFVIMILGYCIYFFGLVALLDSNVQYWMPHATFKGFA
jgi:hypothetical protein